MATLGPIDSHDAVELYLDTRRHGLSDSTFSSKEFRLKGFAKRCHN